MNLQSKKVRLPIAALGVTALCSGGIGIFASPAFAATEIGLNTGATTIGVANFGTATTATANAAYALKIQDSSAVTNTAIGVESAPTGGHVRFQKQATNGDATSGAFTPVNTAAANEVETIAFAPTLDGGSYTVTVAGHTTAAINAYDAAALQSALNTALGAGSVTVTGAGTTATPFSITFGGSYAATNVTQLTVDDSAATGGGAPSTATVQTTTNGGAASQSASVGSLVNTDYLYVTGDTPGAYKFRLFQDTNSNGAYDSPDERSSALVTLNVFDIGAGGVGTTVDTNDDVNPVVAATSPSAAGDAIASEITYNKSLSLSDARGTSTADGLPSRLAGLTWLDIDSSAGGVSDVTDQHPTYSSTSNKFTYAVGTPTGAGTITLKGALAASAPGSYPTAGSKAVTVTATDVATLTSDVTAADGSVKNSGGTVAVKAGTATVEYTATAKGAPAGFPPVASVVPNAKVSFTITASAANIAKLSADGTAGATTATTKTYTATTDASGVAKLKVTSTDTTSAMSYTVDTMSNGHSGSTLSTAYATAVPTRIVTTSTSTELTPTVGTTTVTLKGRIEDQFGGAFAPSSGDPQQVTVQIPDGTQAGFAPLNSTGTFSYTYTPPTSPAPAVGDTTTFDFDYGTVPDANSPGGTIRWASSAAASKITLTAPLDGAKDLTIQDNTAPNAAQVAAFGNTTGQIAGTVLGSDNAALAYKSVHLTGGNGVWFSTSATPDADHPLMESMDAVSDASGVLSGVYVLFTKAAEHTVTATSGTATVTSTVTVAAPNSSQGYNVTVDDVSGAPGSTLIVTGKVTDIFGNAVPNAPVVLSTGSSTVGALGSTYVYANTAGVFSTTFVTGSNSSGDVELTATLDNPTTLTPNAAYKTAGVTLADGKDTAAGKIIVAATKLTLSATAKVVAGGSGGTAKLSGKYLPNSSVDIWSKESGEKTYSLMDSVNTDAEGEWGASTKVDKSTYFLAKANGLSSPSDLTQVWSAVSLTAKALGKGKVSLSANGDPNTKSTLTFYRSIGGADPVLKKITSSASGSGKVTVSLPKGTRSVYVTYKAPGTNLGTSKTLKVNVK